jgi:hypothetical protein
MELPRTALAGCALIAAAWLGSAGSAASHSGGLNAEGCHNNRKTGDYHCHRGGGASPTPTARFLSEPTPRRQPGGAYANCAAARAAGAAPVRRGQPGYGPHLDRDGDGIGCER